MGTELKRRPYWRSAELKLLHYAERSGLAAVSIT